jgi:F0F1-type ATP synthase assembly protein I
MATQESSVDLVKKADILADLSFWLFIAMVGTALGALVFKFSFETEQTIFYSLVLIGFGIKVFEVKLLRRAMGSEARSKAVS